MLLIIGEENLLEVYAPFVRNPYNLFQDWDLRKWLKQATHREEQIEWKAEDIVLNAYRP